MSLYSVVNHIMGRVFGDSTSLEASHTKYLGHRRGNKVAILIQRICLLWDPGMETVSPSSDSFNVKQLSI